MEEGVNAIRELQVPVLSQYENVLNELKDDDTRLSLRTRIEFMAQQKRTILEKLSREEALELEGRHWRTYVRYSPLWRLISKRKRRKPRRTQNQRG